MLYFFKFKYFRCLFDSVNQYSRKMVRKWSYSVALTSIQADFSVIKLFVLFLQRWHRGLE